MPPADTAEGQSLSSGRLAQLGERLPYKQEVGGSIPSPPMVLQAAVRDSGSNVDGRVGNDYGNDFTRTGESCHSFCQSCNRR